MESKVKGPAIGLIVLGAIGVILGLLGILGIGGADPDDLAKLDEHQREAPSGIEARDAQRVVCS